MSEIPLYDRDLSWLSFNYRVLLEAQSESVPLLERLRFLALSLIHISEPTRLRRISYAVFCLKKKKQLRTTNDS